MAGGRALLGGADSRAGAGAGGEGDFRGQLAEFQGRHVETIRGIFHVTFLCEARTVVFGMTDQEYEYHHAYGVRETKSKINREVL